MTYKYFHFKIIQNKTSIWYLTLYFKFYRCITKTGQKCLLDYFNFLSLMYFIANWTYSIGFYLDHHNSAFSLTRRDVMIEIDKYGAIVPHSFPVRVIIHLKRSSNTASSCFDCDWPCNVKNRIKYVNPVFEKVFHTYLIELLKMTIQ